MSPTKPLRSVRATAEPPWHHPRSIALTDADILAGGALETTKLARNTHGGMVRVPIDFHSSRCSTNKD
eukprot:scaffold12900_cov77-Skeletonema_dohrnii-CCMP3373.AAC.1